MGLRRIETSLKGPIHDQAVFRPCELWWPGGSLNRPHTIEFCQKAAETQWSEDMVVDTWKRRILLQLLSTAAVAATLMTKEREEYD